MTLSGAQDISSIHWNTSSFPPAFITHGEYKNQGYCDAIRTTLIQNTPTINHTLEVGSIKLAIINLKRLENGCVAGLNMNDERKKSMHYSIPALHSLPNELTIRKEDSDKFTPYLTAQNEIDLEKLLKEDRYIFGYVEKRAYNTNVDMLISKYEKNMTSIARRGHDLTKGLLQMLAYKRVDYIIEYPAMVSYIKEKHDIDTAFVHFPIKDASELINVYVACSKTTTGEKIIASFNDIIEHNKEQFSTAYKRWLPSDSLMRYDQALEKLSF